MTEKEWLDFVHESVTEKGRISLADLKWLTNLGQQIGFNQRQVEEKIDAVMSSRQKARLKIDTVSG